MFSFGAARAAVILSDTFAYPDGSLITNSSFRWKAHSGATGQTQVLAGRVQLSQGDSEDVSAALTNAPYKEGSLYAGFVVNFSVLPSGSGNYFAHLKDDGTSNFRAKVFATTNGAGMGAFRVGLANFAGTPAAVVPTDLALGSNYALVVRYTPGAPATTLWLDPASEAATVNRADAADTASALGITTFALRQSDSGGGMGVLSLDDLIVATTFAEVRPAVANSPPVILEQPQDQTVAQGANATFTVTATGTPAPTYQWLFQGTNLPGATASALTLTNVTSANAGVYRVTITNLAGRTNSDPATLTVTPPAPAGFSVLTYNTHGILAEDWSTNAPQVQAIGRQMQHLQPDIVTFQEIPLAHTWQMVNFVAAYLPGYVLATNSGTDGYIRSVIASRFPITRSQKWLDGASLASFGYAGDFTRDLFEAQIVVPEFPQPLHVFTTHLKSGQGGDDSARRSAEAGAISNFLVAGFLATNALHPYLLTGDLNEDIARPPTSGPQTLQHLTSPPTGLLLTTPLNPFSGSDMTFSIQAASLTKRYDYILPCGLLCSNVTSSQIFRSDLLANPPPPLLSADSATGSDHLPVLMIFNNPYDKPYRLTAVAWRHPTLTLCWEAVPGQSYCLDVSSNLTTWETLASNLLATNHSFTLTTNLDGSPRFVRVHRSP
jgi:endonuclease/exonuclease/phosphatase family metal-dependent hydrolase